MRAWAALLASLLDGDAAAQDDAYDARVKAAFAAAERFQGPLDGAWTLNAPGAPLYDLQLVDKGGRIEGAWRRLEPPASGLVDAAERTPTTVILRFDAAVLTLKPDLTGTLQRQGPAAPVVLRRIGR
jgi:hypothetical protein